MRLLSRDDLTVGMRFLAALPRFLRTPLSIAACSSSRGMYGSCQRSAGMTHL